MKKRKTLTIQEYELPVVVQEQARGGYVALCTKWKDCYAQGETVEEAINELSAVAASLIELYKEEELKVPLELKKTSKKDVRDLVFKFPLIIST